MHTAAGVTCVGLRSEQTAPPPAVETMAGREGGGRQTPLQYSSAIRGRATSVELSHQQRTVLHVVNPKDRLGSLLRRIIRACLTLDDHLIFVRINSSENTEAGEEELQNTAFSYLTSTVEDTLWVTRRLEVMVICQLQIQTICGLFFPLQKPPSVVSQPGCSYKGALWPINSEASFPHFSLWPEANAGVTHRRNNLHPTCHKHLQDMVSMITILVICHKGRAGGRHPQERR